MQPEGRDQNLPDPNTFDGVDQFSDAFAVSRSHGQGSPTDYTYGDSYIPRSDTEIRREPDPENTPDEGESAVKTGKRRRRTFALAGAAVVLVCGMGVGTAMLSPAVVKAISGAGQEEVTAEAPTSDSIYEPAPSDVTISALPVEGWSRASKTKINLADSASPLTMTNGMVASVVSNGYLHVVDPTTGESVFKSSIADARGTVTYVSETGDSSVAWRSGSHFYTWSEAEGESDYEFTEDSRLYSSGSLPVVWEKGSSSVSILKAGGKKLDTTIPDGTVPVGVSGGNKLVSASAKNPVWITDITGEATDGDSPITLEAPKKGMVIRKWIGMSNGNIVVAWSSSGEVASSSSVSLTVHSVEDGSIIATTSVLWGSVAESNMVPDQTRTKFGIGYTYFDGKQFVSSDNKEALISSYAGDRIYAKIGDQSGEFTSGSWKPFPEGTVTPLGIGPEGEAIIKMDTTGYALTQEGK